MQSTKIESLDVEPGDVIDCCGETHRVTHVDRRVGWAWPIAFDDAGWAMALGHAVVEVRRELGDDATTTGADAPPGSADGR